MGGGRGRRPYRPLETHNSDYQPRYGGPPPRRHPRPYYLPPGHPRHHQPMSQLEYFSKLKSGSDDSCRCGLITGRLCGHQVVQSDREAKARRTEPYLKGDCETNGLYECHQSGAEAVLVKKCRNCYSEGNSVQCQSYH
ncbi:uncharacterized protein LOC128965135 [Oppia nitens]|uniref:uncharacterized protein LOC128965135 n=1 Tax=Oppia nitens TaxID=1686743 RepID=UPI0023D9B01B|nr:uncharacterized protein LOC128965135 [Oppia nitens]